MPAPLALPILLASKFLSNTFWGFPQPPPQILAGRSGFPFPKEAGSFQGPAWEGQDEVGDSLLTPDVCCSSTASLQTPSPLPRQWLGEDRSLGIMPVGRLSGVLKNLGLAWA